MFNLFLNHSKKYNAVWVSKNTTTTFQRNSTHPVQTTRTNVAPLLTQIVAQLMPLAQSKMIDLDLRLFSNEVFADVHADCFCLMVYNLIGHSLKDAPTNGCVSVDAYTEGLDFVLIVMHNGNAVTEEEVSFLFNLEQDHSVQTRQAVAPGIGLDSVKQIVDAHKGQLLAESRAGRGSAYTVKLHMIGDVYS
ncbi:MAG: ATP-binding protein [Chloroflexota bacterium]